MDKLRIKGGRALNGTVGISGAKNAVLPAMAASLLTDHPVILRRVPQVRDVRTMVRLLELLGKKVQPLDDGGLRICGGESENAVRRVPYDLVKTMRASVLCLGPLVARDGSALVSLPGGCAIGARPINLHLFGLRKMGADVSIEQGYVNAEASMLRGAEIFLDKPTVTGTENLMMAAALARGTTVIRNAAREPEIGDLAEMLIAMGASLDGAGTATITVEGVPELGGAEHSVIPDRIETATYLMVGAAAGGRVRLEGCRPDTLTSVLEIMEETGARLDVGEQAITVTGGMDLQAKDLQTDPYPGFPTDVQAQYMALMTQARGASVITEQVFENRFMHVAELRRFGADIRVSGRAAVVQGPTPLQGAPVMATDIRASASLVVAGVLARGETVIDRIYHLDRGYEKLEEKLSGLGAEVERIS